MPFMLFNAKIDFYDDPQNTIDQDFPQGRNIIVLFTGTIYTSKSTRK